MALAEKVAEKLSVPANTIILRYEHLSLLGWGGGGGEEAPQKTSPVSFSSSSEATDAVINGDADMAALWGGLSGRCITLWCRLTEVSDLC